tara:strand:+ start:246 stop:554 length:309 start_codon:yes stop_codon:yes gene_type:complete
MSVQLELMNFRVPVDVRETFSQLCKFNRRSMSSQVIDMMKHYIEVEGKKTLDSIKSSEVIMKTLNETSERINQNQMIKYSSDIELDDHTKEKHDYNKWYFER